MIARDEATYPNHTNEYRLLTFVESRPMIVLKLGNSEREVVEEAKNITQLSPEVESTAKQRANERANVAKWQLNVAVFLFAILIIIMVLLSQGFGINVVAHPWLSLD